MTPSQSRRRFLQIASAGTISAVAGCNGIPGSLSSQDGSSFEPEDGVLTQVGPTQEESQEIRENVLAEAEENGWSESEFRQELNDRFEQRVQEELASFEDWASNQDGVTVKDRVDEVGIVLITGDDSAILDALRNGDLGMLLPGSDFSDAQEAAEQASGQQQSETGTAGDSTSTDP